MKAYIWAFVLWLATAVNQILGKTEILLQEPNKDLWAWRTKRRLTEGAGWNAPSTAKPVYHVCDISTTKQPTNWLRTDFINVKDAKLLNIELHYNLLNCPGQPYSGIHCRTNFSLFVFHIDKKATPAPEPFGNVVKYDEVKTFTHTNLPPPGDPPREYKSHAQVLTKKRGVYLAFKDQGSCLSMMKVIVSYNYCSEMGSVLVRFKRTVAPVNDSHLVEQEGECTDANSVNKFKFSGVCLSSGEWNVTDGMKCLCKAGYELVNGSELNSLECSECLKDFYKSAASNNKCLHCPANSSSNTGRTNCLCKSGFYKLQNEGSPCKALPQAPLRANITVVKATYVAIKWVRSPDDNNGTLLYSVDCFRCKSSKHKDCQEPCGPGLRYKPSKDNITDVTVTISGLVSDSYFKFRVYSVSELNQKEKDRDKWNYAEVFAKTKAPAVDVQCNNKNMTIIIPKSLLRTRGIDREHLRLLDTTCKATETSAYFFLTTPLTGCNTTSRHTPTAIVYSNAITEIPVAAEDVVTRVREIEIRFSCFYSKYGMVSSVGWKPSNKKLVFSYEGKGNFTLSLNMFPDKRFASPYMKGDFPVAVVLRKLLFFEVSVTSGDKQLSIIADRCYATPTQNQKNFLKYEFITKGCPNDVTVKYHSAPSISTQRFSLEAFKFIADHPYVFVHCHVIVCNATDPGSKCAKKCSSGGRGRREVSGDWNDDVYSLAQGPLHLAREKREQKSDSGVEKSGTSPSLMMALFLVCVACLVEQRWWR